MAEDAAGAGGESEPGPPASPAQPAPDTVATPAAAPVEEPGGDGDGDGAPPASGEGGSAPQVAATGGDAGEEAAAPEGGASASDAAASDAATGAAPKGDLASRLQSKGIGLLSSEAAGGASEKQAASSSSSPAPLGLSTSIKRKLFTPLTAQGTKALKKEQRRQMEGEEDLLESVRATLARWVQECLAKEDKRAKLMEKGILRCRFQAKFSEGIAEKLKALAARYGAKLAADREKEGAEKPPSYLPRNESWVIGFDAKALETFAAIHAEVVDPPSVKVRDFVEEFAVANSNATLKDLYEALQQRFGPMRRAALMRVRRMAEAAMQKKQGGPKAKKLSRDKEIADAAEERKAKIELPEDVGWAAATLLPLGFQASGEPVVRVPPVVALPILEGLRRLTEVFRPADLRQVLKETGIGKVVNVYRHSQSPDVAKVCKDLLASWRTACKDKDRPPKAAAAGAGDAEKKRPAPPADAGAEPPAKAAHVILPTASGGAANGASPPPASPQSPPGDGSPAAPPPPAPEAAASQ